jgi:hypothetical protein
MIDYVIRLAKRFAVLLPGIAIAYFSVRDIFPFFDKKLPLALAVFVTYVLGAYVLIPALIRIIRIFHPAKHLPHYCVTPDGFASDPLNVGIIGSRQELISAMEAAGWHVADKHSAKNVAQELVSSALNHPYPTAPMSSLYLFGRKQDVGFEIPIAGERGQRHHVRFWATNHVDERPLTINSIRWQGRKPLHQDENLLWLGAASRDVGITLIKHNVQVTHMIDADTNAERELIVSGLQDSKLVKHEDSIRVGRPYKLINRAWRGQLHSDGKITVITLKSKG